MFCIRMADITVQIEHQYPYVKHLCRDYLVDSDTTPDLIVSVSKEEIEKEMQEADINASVAYAEAVCVYRTICKQLPSQFQSFLMHCAVIEYEGRGYAFAAQSGTGKSTHIGLWKKQFGQGVHIVNGDKPILRFEGENLIAYGTPWCGKEGFQSNTSVPLHAICFLERSETNRISKIETDEAVRRIFHQVLTPEDIETVDALFPLLDQMIRQIPCYVLGCNMSVDAAQVAYEGMKN